MVPCEQHYPRSNTPSNNKQGWIERFLEALENLAMVAAAETRQVVLR